MKNELILMICLFLVIQIHGQAGPGIRWTTGLSWQQVKEKAKKENKYIFLDCYATWCGPCKMMDREVYINDTIGHFFNNKFISVRVQIDRTLNDNDDAKSWYDDAESIARQYHIRVFPTYIFFNPEAEVTTMETGYWDVSNFLLIGQAAVKPGQLFKDPYQRYYKLLEEYEKGIIKYDSLDFMIGKAKDLNDTVAKRALMKTYIEHLRSLPPSQRYVEKNIIFWSTLTLSSKSILFQWIFNNEKKIDRLMKEQGCAAAMVDKAIYNEIIIPFLTEQNRNPILPMTGMYMSGGSLKPDSSEADWTKLYGIIKAKYNKVTAERNVLVARIEWYKRHLYKDGVSKYLLQLVERYPRDLKKCLFELNNQAWEVFLNIKDKKLINGYAKWMEKLLLVFPKESTIMDTYANLLYKMGRRKEALAWQEKAVKSSDKRHFDIYNTALGQMKRGEPTYNVQPL